MRQGLGFQVSGLGEGLGFPSFGLGFRGHKVSGFGLCGPCLGFRVSGCAGPVWGLGFRVSGFGLKGFGLCGPCHLLSGL